MINYQIYDSDVSIALSSIKSHSEVIKKFKTDSIKDYLFYMKDGAISSSNIFEYYLKYEVKSGVFDENKVIDLLELESYSNSISKNRGKFKLYGVIEFEGLIGYQLFQNSEDSRMLLDSLKIKLSKTLNLDVDYLHYLGGLHKDTKDRHIHFLFYSTKDKKINRFDDFNMAFEKEIISSISSFLNSNEYRKYLDKRYSLNNLSSEEKALCIMNQNRCEIEINCLEIIEYFKENSNLKFDEYEDLDEVIKLSIDSISEKIICVDSKLEEKYKTFKEDLIESFLLIKNEEISDLDEINSLLDPVRFNVFKFLKENINKQRFIFSMNIFENTKKEIGKNNLYEFHLGYQNLEKETNEYVFKKLKNVKIKEFLY